MRANGQASYSEAGIAAWRLEELPEEGGKSQIPSSRSQGNSKSQAPNGVLLGSERPFELKERTAQFGEAIVRFSKKITRSPTNNRLIDQLVGSGTSVGANYCEADERVSKKDFRNTIGRCVKEAKETKFFLRMIAASEPTLAPEARKLFQEAKELHLIFASIYRK